MSWRSGSFGVPTVRIRARTAEEYRPPNWLGRIVGSYTVWLVLLSPAMWKKALTPISIVVLLVGVGMILYSTFGNDDASDGSTSDTSVLIGDSMPESSIPGETSPVGDSSAPSATSGAPAPGETAAPAASSPSSSSSVVPTPSSIFFPTLPSFVSPPSSFITIAPGLIGALTCNSFKTCAQKLYDAWKSNSKAIATNYATAAAVNVLFAYPYTTANGTWTDFVFTEGNPNVYAASCCAGAPKRIEFRFVAGQSGFKVQSVVVP